MSAGSLFTLSREVEILARPQSLWNGLAIQTRQQDPFCCSPAWQLAFHEAFSPKRRLLIRHSGDSLVAFAEKVFTSENVYLTPIEPKWFFGNNVLGPKGVALLRDILFDIERHYAPIFPKLMISAVPPRGGVYKQLRQKFSEFSFTRHSSDTQCAASLVGGFDGFLSRRSANHRRNLKKQSRRAAQKGVTFERCNPSSVSEADAIYARMISIELASWKGIGECGMAQPGLKEFYHAMLRRMVASQGARVAFAKYEDKDIGFIFGGMIGDIYRGQQFSFDEEWRDASIGNLLQLEQIKWLCEEGARRYDMGPLIGPRMDYKRHWTEERFRIETWILEKE
jgi:hypothetical protein